MVKKSVLLHFGASLVDKPIITGLIRDYDVSVNILHARVTPEEEGTMFVHIEGVEDKVSKALDYLNQIGIRLVFPRKNLIWQEAKCTHCGSCVGQCFPDALLIDNETELVLFKHELCVACGLCIPACPFGALESVDQHVATSQK